MDYQGSMSHHQGLLNDLFPELTPFSSSYCHLLRLLSSIVLLYMCGSYWQCIPHWLTFLILKSILLSSNLTQCPGQLNLSNLIIFPIMTEWHTSYSYSSYVRISPQDHMRYIFSLSSHFPIVRAYYIYSRLVSSIVLLSRRISYQRYLSYTPILIIFKSNLLSSHVALSPVQLNLPSLINFTIITERYISYFYPSCVQIYPQDHARYNFQSMFSP